MGISDATIQHLGRIADDASRKATSPKARGAAYLKALRQEFEAQVIPADSLVFGSGQAHRALPGHLLLCEDHEVRFNHEQVWGALSGTGEHYNGMYGTVEELLTGRGAITDAAITARLLSDDPAKSWKPASIGVRIGLALRVLASPSVSRSMRREATAVQLMLSQELLAYPVLLHPNVLVPFVGDMTRGKYVPLVHALFECGSASLPRRSHFEAGVSPSGTEAVNLAVDSLKGRLTTTVVSSDNVAATAVAKRSSAASGDRPDALEQRLIDFAQHPCLRLALSRASISVMDRDPDAGPGPASERIRRVRSRVVPATLRVPRAAPALMASLMELESLVTRCARPDSAESTVLHGAMPYPLSVLAGVSTQASSLDDPDGTTVAAGAGEVVVTGRNDADLVAQTLVASFFNAVGTLHIPSSVLRTGDMPMSARCHTPDRGFIRELRARLAALREVPEFDAKLRAQMQRRVFMGRYDELSPADVEFNAKRVLEGLVSSGLCTDARAAAILMFETTLGKERPDGRLPKATVESAAAFVQVLVDHGAMGRVMGPDHTDMDSAFEVLMPRAMWGVQGYPDFATPFREAWMQAMELVSNEVRMRAVIEAVSSSSTSAATAEPLRESAAPPAPVRRRVAV